MANAVRDAYSSGMRGSEKAKQGPLRRVAVEVADNGFTASPDFESLRRDKDGYPMYEPGPPPKVFESKERLMEYLDKLLPGAGSEEAGEETAEEAEEA